MPRGLKVIPCFGTTLLFSTLVVLQCFGQNRIDLHPQIFRANGHVVIDFWSGSQKVGFASTNSPAGIRLRFAGGVFDPVRFTQKRGNKARFTLGPARVGTLQLKLIIEQLNESLIQRTLEVTATAPQKFAVSFDFFPANPKGEFASFSGTAKQHTLYDTLGGGPEYPDVRGETFPVACFRSHDLVFGVIADSPANWENRCLVELDPENRRIAALTGDGRDPYELHIKYDAKDAYKYQMDGWQTLAAGETRRFTTWLFADRALSQYDLQLAAHLALANAKGWNSSALEAILRNTAYLLCRRNLMRDESRYLFISGIGYGWKQWVSDGFWMAVGLGDREKLIEAYHAVFENRITYEDNAQYYLIWSVLAKRASGQVNQKLATLAYNFIRQHETNGVFYPPPLAGAPSNKGWKTYLDILEYDDDDAPVSNQGFHCGALMAARELGFPVSEEDIERSITGYKRMFDFDGQYFPTSIKKRDQIGQDTLYGAALTYAVFGRKILDDSSVQAHMQTTARVQSPFGMPWRNRSTLLLPPLIHAGIASPNGKGILSPKGVLKSVLSCT